MNGSRQLPLQYQIGACALRMPLVNLTGILANISVACTRALLLKSLINKENNALIGSCSYPTMKTRLHPSLLARVKSHTEGGNLVDNFCRFKLRNYCSLASGKPKDGFPHFKALHPAVKRLGIAEAMGHFVSLTMLTRG